eukprot:TRINITY_DN22696_c0_g1_i1.p1 TRINITY_DN22696_c0_g1~~TRINITY_DN22696_c0_g1_i1.p1  ORF type:complete len:261 (+),score=60.11 TRINITY_DN22696_c0_g1_i1:56-784(+)
MFSYFSCCCEEKSDERGDLIRPENLFPRSTDEVQIEHFKEAEQEQESWARPAEADAFLDVAEMFEIQVYRTPTTFYGMDLSVAGKVCMVNSVEQDSLVGLHNRAATDQMQVKRHHRLLYVNGDGGSGKEVLEKLKAYVGAVTLKFQSPCCNKVTFRKDAEGSIGLSLKEGPDFLLVLNVREGSPAEEYNATATDEKSILASSRVLSVDGVMDSGSNLMAMVKAARQELTLTFLTWPDMRSQL